MYDNFFKTFIILSIFFLEVCCFTETKAQQNEIDSLQSLLGKAQGEERFDILFRLFVLNAGNQDQQVPVRYAQEAYQLANSLGDSLRIVKSQRAIANTYLKRGEMEEAIKFYEVALRTAKRNGYNEQIKFGLNNMAIAYTYQANYDKALDYHFQSLLIREKEGNKIELSVSYNNIGFVYLRLKDFEKALEYFKKSLDIIKGPGETPNLDRYMMNMGLCYSGLNDSDKAIEYLTKAFELCKDQCSDDVTIEGHFGLGNVYQRHGDFEKAQKEYQFSYQRSVKTNNKRFWAENLINLNELSFAKRDFKACENYLLEAEKILDNSGFNELQIVVYNEFSKVYRAMSDFEHASLYQAKYIGLKDSIINDELIKNLAKVQTNFEERENIATIAANEEELSRQRRLNVAIIIIAVLATLLIFVLFRSNQIKKRTNKQLSDAKVTIENQNKQLTMLNRNLEKMVDARTVELQIANESLKRVNDELDNFIYKTSHDIRGPLASLKGMCNVAIMDVKDELALNYFYKLDATAERLNTILTRLLIINQINNSSASHELIDFASIIDDVIILEKKKGLPPHLTISKEIEDKVVLYSDKELIRIILENLIDNAIKFYNDSDRADPFVKIKIGRDNGEIRIRVIDNGIGVSQINPDKIFQMFSRASERSGTGGIGLYLTKTATEKLGGQIDLKTTPEGFTEFYVKFSNNNPT